MRTVVLLCVVLVGGSVFADTPSNDDARFRADIATVSSDAAAAWDRGIALVREHHASLREADVDAAIAAFKQAIALAPNVDHPHRQLCEAYASKRQFEEAVRECEQALSISPTSPYDRSALAQAMGMRGHPEDEPRARSLADSAAQALPDNVSIVRVECLTRTGPKAEVNDLATCVDHLLALAPDDVVGNVMATEVALVRGDASAAQSHLDRAKRAGLGPMASMQARIDALAKHDSRLSLHDVITVAVAVVGGWIALYLILLLVGRWLSRAALVRAEHLTAEDVEGTPRERWLRRLYRLVMGLTAVFFYVSLPLLVIVVIAASLTTMIIFDEMGATPVIVLLALAVIVITTITSITKALFSSPAPEIEGKKIDPRSYPALRAVLDDCAKAVTTRPVDTVYLTAGTDAGVLERRTLFQAMRGARCERVLILGVALFDNMKQRELRSILAHEYGHFRNADTGGSLEIRRSLLTLVNGIATSGYALINPAWWVMRAFTHLYLVVSTGASRLQEMLADRWAIRAYGSDAFATGMRHVIAREVEFPSDVNQIIDEVVKNGWSLPNVYAYDLERKVPAAALEAAIAKRMSRAPQRFDSHPTTQQRIAWAEQLALPGDRTSADDPLPVWSLFPDPEAIEREMTAIIRERAQRRLDVTISAAEWDDEATNDKS